MSKSGELDKPYQEQIDIETLLIKEFGNIVQSPDSLKKTSKQIISVTPKLDILLGGGISEGTLNVIAGPPKVGKTVLSLQIAKNALNIDTNGHKRQCYYFNIESRIKERDLFGIQGLDLSRVKIITSSPGKILHGENFLEIAEKIVNTQNGAVIIFDSFSALCSKARLESDLGERFRDDMPLIIGSFCRRIASVININKCILLGINHLYANSSGKGHKVWLESAGQKIQYSLDTKFLGLFNRPWLNSAGSQIGLEIYWNIPVTYLSGGIGGETNTFFKFGEGYSLAQEYVDIAVDIGIIKKSGAWYEYKNNKYQGIDKLRSVFENSQKELKELSDKVLGLFQRPNNTKT